MTPDNEIRTAKAVQYRRVMDRPVITAQNDQEDDTDCDTDTSNPTSRPDLRKYDTTYPDIGIRDGRAMYLSCLERGYSQEIAQRVVDWERKHPMAVDGLAATDRYLARDARPWERPPPPIWAPAVCPLWHQVLPSPPLSSSEPPPKYPPPQSQYIGERPRPRPPIRNFKRLNLRAATGSHSPHPTSNVANDQCTVQKAEKVAGHPHPLVSYLTGKFLRDGIARNPRQADYLRNQREKREAEERRKQRKQREIENEKAKREQTPAVEKRPKLEDVPIWLKDLARSWRERYPGPDKLFRKDFDFGPRTQGKDDDDYRRPLSPCSSGNSLPDLSPEVRSKSLKRQRHDSSNADVGREPSHDRLHFTSSPIPIQRPQPNTSTSRSLFRGFGTPEIHPGQRVDFTACTSPMFEVDCSNGDRIRFLTSDYNRDDDVDYFRTRTYSPINHVHDHWTPTTPRVVDRDSCCEMDLRHHAETVFNHQGKLEDNAEEAQAAVDEAVRMKTCELQRKPRTTRDHPPALFEPMSKTRTAEPQVTKWSPVMSSLDRTKTTQISAALQDERIKRRRSYVARCRSTDAFLRNVRESQKRRQLERDMEYEGRPRQDTPDPRCPEEEDDWLGDDPL